MGCALPETSNFGWLGVLYHYAWGIKASETVSSFLLGSQIPPAKPTNTRILRQCVQHRPLQSYERGLSASYTVSKESGTHFIHAASPAAEPLSNMPPFLDTGTMIELKIKKT